MKHKHTSTTLWFVLAAFLSANSNAAAEWNSSVSYYSDYYFRGLGYEKNLASFSLLTEVRAGNGFYGGLWLGRNDVEESIYYKKEVDYWLGYGLQINDSFAADISLNRYTFPGSWPRDYDWSEAQLSLHYQQQWSVTFGVNENQFTLDRQGEFIEVTHRRALGLGLVFDGSIGAVHSDTLLNPYAYYQFGLSRQIKSAQIRLTWITADGDALTSPYARIKADKQWLLALLYSF